MNVNEYDLIFTELGYLTHYSRMTPVIYRFALLVVYTASSHSHHADVSISSGMHLHYPC